MERLPDIDVARRIFSHIIPQLSKAELEIRALEAKFYRGKRRRMTGERVFGHRRWGQLPERETENFKGCCKILGIDSEIFTGLTDQQKKDFVDRQRRLWANMLHRGGDYPTSRMKEINAAADFLRDYFDILKIEGN